MTPAAILALVLQYGPQVLPLIQQLTAWVKENKTEVTAADLDILIAFGKAKASDFGLPPSTLP